MSNFLLSRMLNRFVTHGTLTVCEPGGRRRAFGTPESGWPDLRLVLRDDKAARLLVHNPSLGMGEAYMDGRVEIEGGDILDFLELIRRNNPWDDSENIDQVSYLRHLGRRLGNRIEQVNRRTASRRHVAHHYDLDDRLYDIFLGRNRQYSCAYWDEDVTSLDEAQLAKMNHIAAKLALEPGMRVLDIGCGWGGLALHLHRIADVSVHGITLSQEQFAYAKAWADREGVSDKVTFGLTDYRDVKGKFDRIVSVGMFEHVGARNFPAFFRQCHNLLARDGVMLLHTIGRVGPPDITDDFIRKYIFPGGYIPALSETMQASEPCKLMLSDVEVLRIHYAKTLREWYRRCAQAHEKIVSIYDERFYRMWQFYLAGAATAFENGDLVNFQFQYLRDRETVPTTRKYIDRAESLYRGVGSGASNVIRLASTTRGLH